MEEVTETKVRKPRSDKGRKRGPRLVAPTPVREMEPPIHVRLRLKGYPEAVEFGCARRAVENGFHVFFYPSERDRYRETRREFAISEILEIEITEARQVFEYTVAREEAVVPPRPSAPSRPVIHSARQSALANLENSNGPIKMDKLPNLSFGDSAE